MTASRRSHTISVAPRRARLGLYTQFRQQNFNAERVAKFLRQLLRHLRGEVILIWDGGRIHRGPFIRAVQADYPRLHLERFPGYTPELNPVEQLWGNFKRRTANALLRHKQDIRLSLHGSTKRVKRSGTLLKSFVQASNLPSMPWN